MLKLSLNKNKRDWTVTREHVCFVTYCCTNTVSDSGFIHLLNPSLEARTAQYSKARRLALASKFAQLDSVESVSRHYDTSPNKKALEGGKKLPAQ